MTWTLTAIGVLLLPSQSTPRPSGTQILSADLEGGGVTEQVLFTPRHDPTIEIRRNGRRVCTGIPLRLHPWKLAIGDVDGDGKPELVFGVRKATRFFPKPHAGLFVYGFDGTTLVKKWLGSHLADPLIDFALVQPLGGGRCKLVALERRRGGRFGLTVYSWIGFGFGADRQIGRWKRARIVRAGSGAVVVEADGRRRVLRVE